MGEEKGINRQRNTCGDRNLIKEGRLERSLAAVFGSLIQQAQQHYTQAQGYLKQDNWAGYGPPPP